MMMVYAKILCPVKEKLNKTYFAKVVYNLSTIVVRMPNRQTVGRS